MHSPLPFSFFDLELYWVSPVFSHSIILLITSGHRTLNILSETTICERLQLLNDWIF
jgi:hypothetical protein